MAEHKPTTVGRMPPGHKKQFLAGLDLDFIRRIKPAAVVRGSTATMLLKQVSREGLRTHQDGKNA